jgi:hypothetical protein
VEVLALSLLAAAALSDPVRPFWLVARLWLLAQEATGGQAAPYGLTLANIGVAGLWIWSLIKERDRLRDELSQRTTEDRQLLIPTVAKAGEIHLRVLGVLEGMEGRRGR